MSGLLEQLYGNRLTTASIFYHRPDHPLLLQSYIWQQHDKTPDYPQLSRFLDFWCEELETAPIHSVELAAQTEISSGLLRRFDFEIISVHHSGASHSVL